MNIAWVSPTLESNGFSGACRRGRDASHLIAAERKPKQRLDRGQGDGHQLSFLEKLPGEAAFQPEPIDHAVDGDSMTAAFGFAVGTTLGPQKITDQPLQVIAE